MAAPTLKRNGSKSDIGVKEEVTNIIIKGM